MDLLGYWAFGGSKQLCQELFTRVEWIHAFLEIAKGPSTFRSTSQRWFHNKWRNCYRMNILSQKWANISYRKQRLLWIYNRAEWKTQKLEFSKSSSRFRTASQHWFQNNWRNHYRMNILLLNQENSFYRERKLQHSPISSNFLMNGIFVNKVTVSAVTPFRIIWNRSKCSPWGLLGTHRGPKRVHLT